MALTKNKNVLAWVDEMVALTKPDKVVWICLLYTSDAADD